MSAAASLPFASAHPFIKWAGGKTSLLAKLTEYAPPTFGAYYEPMLGGGAFFWHLARLERLRGAVYLSDVCSPLIRSYLAVAGDLDELIRLLRAMPVDQAFYYELRGKDPNTMDLAECAAWFIYLNKTSFNGLWRVNRKGQFNVPWGRWEVQKRTPLIFEEGALRACSRALRHANIQRRAYTAIEPRKGDFVYFDPPYLPVSKTSSFTAYQADPFLLKEHEALRDFARTLKDRGVHVMISNSNADQIRELYSGGAFEIREVEAPRAINSKAGGRQKVKELVIR